MKIPASIEILFRKLSASPFGWSGNYSSWQAAKTVCSGYDKSTILEKVKAATLKVKNGEAIYERDSVLFNRIKYSWPLLSGLMWVAALNKGKLHVIDFGGALGSTYFQNKKFLDTLQEVKWTIIEQPAFVAVGQQDITEHYLQFFGSVEEAIDENGLPDILIISCTLPYLEEPYKLLNHLTRLNIPYLMIDNTPFNYVSQDRITVQKVNPLIYDASYPCWLLNYNKVVDAVQKRYSIISEHLNDLKIYVEGREIQYKGFLAKNKMGV